MMNQEILIVDDEIQMCKSLYKILESESLDAFYSTKPSQAMRLISENDIDLIFLDIKMPELVSVQRGGCCQIHKMDRFVEKF